MSLGLEVIYVQTNSSLLDLYIVDFQTLYEIICGLYSGGLIFGRIGGGVGGGLFSEFSPAQQKDSKEVITLE